MYKPIVRIYLLAHPRLTAPDCSFEGTSQFFGVHEKHGSFSSHCVQRQVSEVNGKNHLNTTYSRSKQGWTERQILTTGWNVARFYGKMKVQ